MNVFFRLAAGTAALFIVTIFAFVATMFGNPEAPVNQFLDRRGSVLIVVEVLLILTFVCLALVVDRRQILKDRRENPIPPPSSKEKSNETANENTVESSTDQPEANEESVR